MKINQTKKKEFKKSLREAYLKAISQENKIKTKANCMQPMNPEKQQLHNKRLQKDYALPLTLLIQPHIQPLIMMEFRQKTDWSAQNLLEVEGKKQQNQNKTIRRNLINKISAKPQKQTKCEFNKLTMWLTHSGISSGILFCFLPGCNPTETYCSLNNSTVVS